MLTLSVLFVVSALSGLILTPLVIRMAVAWGLFDAPHGDRRVHTEPIPRVGGVAVFASMGIGLVVLAASSVSGLGSVGPFSSLLSGVLFGSGIIFATGLIDDLIGLRPGVKFIAQLIAAGVVYVYGFRVGVLSFGSETQIDVGWLSMPITILWIVGVTNAFNLIDGLDGLATGIAIISLTVMLAVSVTLGNTEAVILCVALLGSLLAFLRFNFSPARIFLGDSGSLFLGFMLAVLTVYGSQVRGNSVLGLIPLFCLAIPLLDTALAMLRRFLRGVPLSQADGRHIHHRLLALGLSHRHAVVVLYLVAAVLASLGLSLVVAPPPAIVGIAAAAGGVALALVVYGLRRLQYHEFVEAASVLVSGMGRVKRAIRDRIYAQDVGEIVRQSESLEHVNVILEDHAATFGFLHIEVCRDGAGGPRPLVLFNGHAARAWKLDYPVTSHDFIEGDDYVLRIWCNPRDGSRPYGAERVAQILAPTIERWMLERGPRRDPSRMPITNTERAIAEPGAVLAEHLHVPSHLGAGVRPGA
jgi:UDP-GlcNAc:undecaprenyl-phosphate GlcNAc-1-phosphate transferase